MRWYRLLLRLYPTSFRHEYGDEMTWIFRDRLHAAGTLGRAGALLGAPFEVLASAATAHWDLLRQDLRQAVRGFVRSPAFALTALLVIALGVGANTAVFSVTDHALFASLPFPDADRILKIWERLPGYSHMELSPANYRDWRERWTTIESAGAYTRAGANLTGEGDPVRLDGAWIQAELSAVLGVGPLLGRGFTEDDELPGAAPVVQISHALWQTRFGADSGVVGRVVRLDGEPYTVVGVMPKSFLFPHRDVQYWIPLRLPEEAYLDRNDNFIEIAARPRPGVAIEQVEAELEQITTELEELYPADNKDVRANVVPLHEEHSQQARLLLLALAGAALCVLLISCVNLANLLLARALQRQRELTVRAAMGAGRERLTRQLLTETLLLALAGGAIGIALAYWSLPLFSRLVPTSLPIDTRPTIDLRVLLFASTITLLTGVVVGLLPVLRATRRGMMTALREGGRGGDRRERLRSALVVASVVCSVVLLASAGLLLRALWRVQSTDPGFGTENVLTLRISLPQPDYEQTARRVQWYREVADELTSRPGVESAGFISFLPMTMTGGIWPVITGDASARREDGNVASLRFATPGLFDALGIALHQGRGLQWSDTADSPFVAVVSESFVERYFPNRQPVGERFEFGFFEREIVGVVEDIRVRGLERPSEPQVYLSASQVPDGGLVFYTPQDLAIRASLPPEQLLGTIREVVRATDPALPISNVRTTAEIVAAQTASRSVQARVVLTFAGVALLLAAVGIHGLLSFLVSQRRREIGVRVALGAARGQVLRLVLARGARLALWGVGIGSLVAYAAGRSLEAILAGVPAGDPVTLLVVAGVCSFMTLLGSLVPAIRALRVDPVIAIRVD